MKLARVIGSVEATVKDPSLTGKKLLVAEIEDFSGEPARSIVAVDGCGAGKDDQVLITMNGAARMPGSAAGAPVDATIIAIVDRVRVAK